MNTQHNKLKALLFATIITFNCSTSVYALEESSCITANIECSESSEVTINPNFEQVHEGYSYKFDVTDADYSNNTFCGNIVLRNHTTKPFTEWAISFDANFTLSDDNSNQFTKTDTGYIYTSNASLLSNIPFSIELSGDIDCSEPMITNLKLFTEPIAYTNPIMSNDDNKYPLSISLSDDELVDGFVNVLFSQKDSTQEHEIYISKVNDNSEIVHKTIIGDESILVTVCLNEQYSFNYKSDIKEVVGKFTIYEDSLGFTISQYYDIIGESRVRSSSVSETENNNTTTLADDASCLFEATDNNNNTLITGTVSSSADVDYFKFTALGNGYVNLSLIISGAYNYDLYVQKYINGSLSYIAISTNSRGVSEAVRFAVTGGETYYIRIVNASGSSYLGYQYKLHGAYNVTKAWFSQIRANDNGVQYWNTDSLEKLHFNDGSVPFMIDGSYPKGDFMDEGCGIASMAMVLNNLNATRTCTDYRLGTNMAHPADPFIVMMANINTSIAPTYNSTKKTYNYNTTSDDSDPVLCDWTEIVQGFGYASFEQATINVNSHTAIASLLSEHPEGLIADVGSHYLVICGDRGSNYGTDRFYVCDPGTAYAYKGCYKPFAARGTYDINSIISIYFID